jgi:hypothetical protein
MAPRSELASSAFFFFFSFFFTSGGCHKGGACSAFQAS